MDFSLYICWWIQTGMSLKTLKFINLQTHREYLNSSTQQMVFLLLFIYFCISADVQQSFPFNDTFPKLPELTLFIICLYYSWVGLFFSAKVMATFWLPDNRINHTPKLASVGHQPSDKSSPASRHLVASSMKKFISNARF